MLMSGGDDGVCGVFESPECIGVASAMSHDFRSGPDLRSDPSLSCVVCYDISLIELNEEL